METKTKKPNPVLKAKTLSNAENKIKYIKNLKT